MTRHAEDQVKLSRGNSRRKSSVSFTNDMPTGNHQSPLPNNFLEGGVRRKSLNLGKCCSKMRLHIEREDGGNLLIGGLSLAHNCQAILVIFGFFFIFAGVVLTIISYKTPLNSKVAESSATREQGKVGGPIFLVVGSILFIVGTVLSLAHWRLHREAKLLRSRFSVEGLPLHSRQSSTAQTGDTTAHVQLPSYFLNSSKAMPNSSSSFPSSRRQSLFPSNYFMGRRRTLPTVSQAVPLGFLIDGRVAGYDSNFSSNESRLPSATSRRKASLSLRASLPIPLLGSPKFMRVRSLTPVEGSYQKSDEPFGSIVSLSGTGDIACFPVQRPPRFPPCREEDLVSSQHQLFQCSSSASESVVENNNLTPFCANTNGALPVITVNDTIDPLRTRSSHGRQASFCLTAPQPSQVSIIRDVQVPPTTENTPHLASFMAHKLEDVV